MGFFFFLIAKQSMNRMHVQHIFYKINLNLQNCASVCKPSKFGIKCNVSFNDKRNISMSEEFQTFINYKKLEIQINAKQI